MLKLLPILLFTLMFRSEVQAQCDSAFTYTIYGSTVQFRATDSTPHKLHKWFFGDGAQAWGRLVYHSYSTPGTYLVKHFITDSITNCRDSALEYVTITVPVNCVASFTVSRDSSHPYPYVFTSTSTASGGSIHSYRWTVNGDSVSNASSFDSVFSQGKYYVCLRIRTTTGCSSTICDSINVDTSANCNLSVTFTDSASPANPAQVRFTPNPSDPSLSYFWRFGDGYFSTALAPVHTYSTPGNYQVTLVVTDSASNCKDSSKRFIYIPAPDTCTASFTYTANPLNANQISFTAISNDSIVAQRWYIRPCDSLSIHDSVVYTIPNPVHLFADSGCNIVCVKLFTKSGCIKTYCDTLNIHTDSMMLRNKIIGLIRSFPNPVYTTPVNISLWLAKAEKVKIAVYNSLGRLMYTNERAYASGNHRIIIPAEKLQVGTYYVDIRYGNTRKRSTFQKL